MENKRQIILASQSPRRKELLTLANIPFTVANIHVEEVYPVSLDVNEVPEYLARLKAEAFTGLKSHELIVAADTVVIHDGKIFGKPVDYNDAMNMLEALSGRTHTVITGVCFKTFDKIHAFSEQTEVTFYPLTRQQIEFYVNTYKPFDKAGSYAVQEWIGVHGIRRINGCYFNVMGLPVSRMMRELNQF